MLFLRQDFLRGGETPSLGADSLLVCKQTAAAPTPRLWKPKKPGRCFPFQPAAPGTLSRDPLSPSQWSRTRLSEPRVRRVAPQTQTLPSPTVDASCFVLPALQPPPRSIYSSPGCLHCSACLSIFYPGLKLWESLHAERASGEAVAAPRTPAPSALPSFLRRPLLCSSRRVGIGTGGGGTGRICKCKEAAEDATAAAAAAVQNRSPGRLATGRSGGGSAARGGGACCSWLQAADGRAPAAEASVVAGAARAGRGGSAGTAIVLCAGRRQKKPRAHTHTQASRRGHTHTHGGESIARAPWLTTCFTTHTHTQERCC